MCVKINYLTKNNRIKKIPKWLSNHHRCEVRYAWPFIRGVALITPKRAFRPRNIDHARTDGPALATFTVSQSALRAVLP